MASIIFFSSGITDINRKTLNIRNKRNTKKLELLGIGIREIATIIVSKTFHPSLKNISPVRIELGVKTFFNMLGPMVNPIQPKSQLVGVFNSNIFRLYSQIYSKTNKSYCIVHS